MKTAIKYDTNKASITEITEHLTHCDANFIPPLSSRVNIDDYAKKIATSATRLEAWSAQKLVGLVAAYCNDMEQRTAFITSVSVLTDWRGQGIPSSLINRCVAHVKKIDFSRIKLEAASNNIAAIKLYEKSGFTCCQAKTPIIAMTLKIENDGE